MCRIILKATTTDLFPSAEKENSLSFTNTVKSMRGSLKSSSSHRSKYLSKTRLTQNGLFTAIKGKSSSSLKVRAEELNFEVDLLLDTY